MRDKVGENPAALRAAVFLLSSKNLRGGVQTPPPPSRARVKPPWLKLVAFIANLIIKATYVAIFHCQII